MERIPKNLCETHQLGPQTREWLVSARQVPSFLSTHTLVAGHTEARKGYEFVRHSPAFAQILVCSGGEGQVLIDGHWESCKAGFAYLTSPRTFCAYRVRPGRTWRVCWILYEEKIVLPTLEAGRPPRLAAVDATGIHLAIQGLCHEAGGMGGAESLQFWSALVQQKVRRLLLSAGEEPRLGQLWAAVRHDLAGDWNLRRMAKCAGLSEEALRRLCLRQVGRPPLAHLRHLRMLLAGDLLACTKEKVSSIANRAGYRDAFAFSNAFKREMGKPPSVYRKTRDIPQA